MENITTMPEELTQEEKKRQSHIKAVRKHQVKKTDLLQLRVPKGEKDRLRSEAEKRGKCLTQFLLDAAEDVIRSGR